MSTLAREASRRCTPLRPPPLEHVLLAIFKRLPWIQESMFLNGERVRVCFGGQTMRMGGSVSFEQWVFSPGSFSRAER
jgi:hypothetical protein